MRKTLVVAVLLAAVLLVVGACSCNSVDNIQITYIFYDGLVPGTESDEYVEITNGGDQAQDLAHWMLKDISEGYPSFIFPSYILAPGKSIRVYTNEYHPEWGGFSFEYGKAIWSNSEPDVAVLYNSECKEVSRKSYQVRGTSLRDLNFEFAWDLEIRVYDFTKEEVR